MVKRLLKASKKVRFDPYYTRPNKTIIIKDKEQI